ncbi:MAG: rod shape-determining protein MreC [Defluviicoccus sp.]|nr:rod shape-determining protein MreC [Defluviicoccus sp.]MDE0384369.1 rod shape-determining protein MreC [Defluviicoccus sp.]
MKYRPASIVRLAVPSGTLSQRIVLATLILAAFGITLLGKAETVLFEKLRAGVVDFVAPIMSVVARPAATVADAIEGINELGRLRDENARLRDQNERLLHWQAAGHRLSQENDRLRQLLRFVPEPRVDHIGARVVGDSGGVFVRSIVVVAGARDGVAKGQAAVTGDGMIGRVVAVGNRSARILLITDLNSRIPVMFEGSRERAILAGDNTAMPKISFLRHNARVNSGDRVVTSGHGGMLPPGLPIGVVSSVAGEAIQVRPLAQLDRLEFVRIVAYPEVAFGSASASARGGTGH